mgnify:CR=1 FL=1
MDNLSIKQINHGLKKTVWRGRFQKICNDPFIYYDVAHNFDGILSTINSLKFISILSIASMSQAMNIIDGLNGLSMGVGMIILFTVGTICNIYNDYFLLEISNY